MTATEAFGLPVVADDPTLSPISDRSGRPVLWQQTRTLTLSDGSQVYGCAHCDFVSRNRNSIRPHLSRHTKRSNGKTSAANGQGVAADLTVHELLGQISDLDTLRGDRDRWRSRALKAEKALRTLRSVLGGNA